MDRVHALSFASPTSPLAERRRWLTVLSAAAATLVLSGTVSSAAAGPDPHAPAPAPKQPAASKPAPSKPAASKPVQTQPSTTAAHASDDEHTPAADTHAGGDTDSRAASKPAANSNHKASTENLEVTTPPTAEQALALLTEGNLRWVTDAAQDPNINSARRQATSDNGQKPFVTVLACADSRLPVERIFDRGVGEVFVVRVAGNVVAPQLAGTIEYGLEHLHTPLLVVMGHSKCGAVQAATGGAHIGGNIQTLVDNITPAVDRARKNAPDADGDKLLSAAIQENVWQSIFDLYKSSPIVRDMVMHDKIKVVGAVYDISTGKVEWLGEHPWQDAMVQALAQREAAAATKPGGAANTDQAHADASAEH